METDIKSKTKVKTKVSVVEPKLYKVLMHNDDVTPMDFVVSLLSLIFKHPHNKAYALMMKIHHDGMAVCGLYTKEIAQTRMLQAKALAQSHAFPLNITMEADE
jgi:ATP-dependent Clp protease adaptor protein ClpS